MDAVRDSAGSSREEGRAGAAELALGKAAADVGCALPPVWGILLSGWVYVAVCDGTPAALFTAVASELNTAVSDGGIVTALNAESSFQNLDSSYVTARVQEAKTIILNDQLRAKTERALKSELKRKPVSFSEGDEVLVWRPAAAKKAADKTSAKLMLAAVGPMSL